MELDANRIEQEFLSKKISNIGQDIKPTEAKTFFGDNVMPELQKPTSAAQADEVA